MVMAATKRRVTDKMAVKEIPLTLIDLGQIAKLCDPLPGSVLEDLTAIISQADLLSCLIFPVREKPRRNGAKQRYELVLGDECWRAAKAAHQQTVRAIVMNDLTDTQVAALAAIHKHYHPRLTPMSQARLGHYMHNILGLTLVTAAKLLRVSEHTLVKRLPYVTLPRDIQDLIENKQLKPGHIEELLRLATEKEQRETAHRAVREKLTVNQLKDHLYPGRQQTAANNSSQPSSEETLPPTPQELLRQIGQLVEQVKIDFPSVCAADKPALDQQIGSIVERLQGIQASSVAAPF